MISLHERLSEFSYGYGVTQEIERNLRSVGLQPTPFLPSLLHEAQLGFDVAFDRPGAVLMLQFKLGDELRRFHRASPFDPIPELQRPFWRFKVNTRAPQFKNLLRFQTDGAEVYYVAPRFSSWSTYERAFHHREVLDRSLLVSPREISMAIAGAAGAHRIVYDHTCRYVCSEPHEIEEVPGRDLARRIQERTRRNPISLEAQLKSLVGEEADGNVSRLSSGRRSEISGRAKKPVDALAAIVGVEAWAQGAQTFFVTHSD